VRAATNAALDRSAPIFEYDAGVPRAGAERFTELHLDRAPGDVPPKR
jgi:hypothetical protein